MPSKKSVKSKKVVKKAAKKPAKKTVKAKKPAAKKVTKKAAKKVVVVPSAPKDPVAVMPVVDPSGVVFMNPVPEDVLNKS